MSYQTMLAYITRVVVLPLFLCTKCVSWTFFDRYGFLQTSWSLRALKLSAVAERRRIPCPPLVIRQIGEPHVFEEGAGPA